MSKLMPQERSSVSQSMGLLEFPIKLEKRDGLVSEYSLTYPRVPWWWKCFIIGHGMLFRRERSTIIKRANRCRPLAWGAKTWGARWRGGERPGMAPRNSPPVSTAPDVHCDAAGEIRRPT
ncbi:unnamed protein product, partial [Iphiclides podalirius]